MISLFSSIFYENITWKEQNNDYKRKSKGNIPIDKELLNKYKNVEEIFDNADRFFENNKCI